MTLSSLGTNGSYGGVLYSSYGSSVLLDDILVDGLSCASSSCYGMVVYSNYGGEVVARDVELTGVKTTSTYEYSSVGALLAYVQYGTLDVDGLEVHDSDLTGNFWGVVYAEGSDLTMRNVDVHDNTFASHYSFSGALVNSYSYGNEQTFENLAFRNNDITFDYSYGQVYGGIGYIEGYGNSDVTVRNVDFSNNSFSGVPLYVYGAGFYTGDGSTRIENVVMANNGFADGVYMAGGFLYGYSGEIQVTNVDMSYNDFDFQSTDGGFAHGDWRADMAFTNTNVSTNSFGDVVNGPVVYAAYGLDEPDSGIFSWDHGNVFQSGDGPLFADGYGESLGLTTLEVDPGHADQDTLELASGSALIDAGDPEILDVDGSVSDIGAYGGPSGGSW
ncbi:MAG: hypothetical protein GY913_34580 [Proteobacteria bacterium]|nr:hypothetical protein [Pseudomonadota bacterium]MCP4922057.1 hypothetical protein [Pseudomonadota bacterium]